jgi:hypothetical protein
MVSVPVNGPTAVAVKLTPTVHVWPLVVSVWLEHVSEGEGIWKFGEGERLTGSPFTPVVVVEAGPKVSGRPVGLLFTAVTYLDAVVVP